MLQAEQSKMKGKGKMKNKRLMISVDGIRKYAVIFVIIALSILFTLLNRKFIEGTNILNIIRQSSAMIIFTVGLTFILISGKLDISFVGIACLTSMVAALIMIATNGNIFLGLLGAFVIGAVLGLVNGLLITIFKLNDMIVTLAMATFTAGVTMLLSGGRAIYDLPESYIWIGRGYIGFIPIQVIIMVVIVIIAWVILTKTVFGRRVFAIGGNYTVANLSGIKADKAIVIYYIISSTCATLAGIILSSRIGTAQPQLSSTTLMDGLTACVIGGTAFGGGKGGVLGSMMGAILLTLIANGLTINGVSSYWQLVVSATVLILTIIVYKDE